MARSTAMAPRAPSDAPALTARPVSGRTPVTTRTSPACTDTGSPLAVTASTRSRSGAPGSARAMLLTSVPVCTVTPCSSSWARTRWPSSPSTVGSTSGSRSSWVTARPRADRPSAISRPT